MLTSDVNCLFTPRSEENNGKKTEIIDQPRFHADMQNTSQKCPLISSLTPLFDSTNYLALFRSYQRAMIHCQTFSVARGERNAHFSVLAPRLNVYILVCTDCLVLSDVYIPLLVRIGLFVQIKASLQVDCILQLLRFPVGLLVESSLVSLIVVFDLQSLPTK